MKLIFLPVVLSSSMHRDFWKRHFIRLCTTWKLTNFQVLVTCPTYPLVSSMLLRLVIVKLIILLEHDLYDEVLHAVTDDLYHNWSQHVQIYSGPMLIFL